MLDPLTRGWAVVTSAEVVRLGLGLVASFTVARALGPADYGVYAVLAATVGIVGALAEGGLSEAAVLRLAPLWGAQRELAREHARAFFWLRVGLAAAVIGVLCAAAGPVSRSVLGLQDDGELLRWALLGIVATACSGAISVMLQASGRFAEMSSLTLFNTGLTAVLAVLLALAGQLTIVSALVVLGIGTSLATFVVGRRLVGTDSKVPSVAALRTEGTALLGVGRWLWLASIFAMLAANLDMLIVNHFVEPAAVGAYALAVNLASKANVVNHSLYTVLLPGVAELSDRHAVKRYVRRALLRSAAIGLALALCIPLAEPLVTTIYGAQFAPTVVLLQLLLGVVIFDVLATPVLLLPLAYRRPRQLAAADALRAITLGAVGLSLVPLYGPLGAIAARLVARVAGALLIVGLLGRSAAPLQVQHEEPAGVGHPG